MPDISDDVPLRLKDAVKIAFPAGGMTVSGLRGEINRGRLEAEMIAGKHFVTLRAIREMRERCKVVPPRKVTLGPGHYQSTISPELAQAVFLAKNRQLREAIKKEERERKQREGYRVLRRD